MQPGQLLQDARTATARFRVESLLHEGKHYQIALGADTLMEDKKVCLKVVDYPVEMLSDEAYVRGRRAALEAEMKFLTTSSHMLPEPLDLLHLEGSPAGGQEPVLVYEYQHGETLHERVRTRFPQGMPPAQALSIWRELVQFACDIHEQGYIFRDFDPRHIILGLDDVVQVIGCGNAVVRGEKMNVFKMNTNPCYTAPEIRKEISGKVVKQACDTYSLGCLLSFMLTGIEPRPMAEAPIAHDAYDRLRQDVPVGYKLLVARCLQPLAQKRFATAKEMLAFSTPETLPAPSDDGFGLVEIPAPWDGPEGMDNRALRSKISPGPLVSEKGAQRAPTAATGSEQALEPASTEALEKRDSGMSGKKIALIALILISLLGFIALVIGGIVIAALQ